MLGENIRYARTRRGLTIKELATKVNVNHHIIRDMELKNSLPRRTDISVLLASIAKATNSTITFLITGKMAQNSVVVSECQSIVNSTNKIINSL